MRRSQEEISTLDKGNNPQTERFAPLHTAKKIIVCGLAGDPPHLAHRALVETIAARSDVREVHFTLSGTRPCSEKQYHVSDAHRAKMFKILLHEANPKIHTHVETGSQRASIDQIAQMQNAHPDHEVWWLGGSDHFVRRDEYGGKCEVQHRWKNGTEFMKNVPIMLVLRKGYEQGMIEKPQVCEVIRDLTYDISSTHIRNAHSNGKDITSFVGRKIAAYINRNNLYTKNQE